MKSDKFITELELEAESKNVNLHFRFLENQPAKSLTTIGVGGPVKLILEIFDLPSLQLIVSFIKKNNLNYKILGNGSNLVISEDGVKDVVLKLISKNINFLIPKSSIGKELETSEFSLATEEERSLVDDEKCYRVFAGASMIGLSREFSKLGLSGLEFAAGIPGSLGGAIKMNAGAHGESIDLIVGAVKVVMPDGGLSWLKKSELDFSYRHSKLPQGSVVGEVDLILKQADLEQVKFKRSKALEYRKNTQPLHLPSAGSVFRNPSKTMSAGEILEKLGLKGLRSGGVAFSDLHANWIVRIEDNATSSDVKKLIEIAKVKALKEFNISLTEEIIFWDDKFA